MDASLKEQIDSWLRDDIIDLAESPWASPIIHMAKKDRSFRWAINYRELNKYMVRDAFPTPNLSREIKSLAGSEIHNMQINEDSQQLTAFFLHVWPLSDP